jgi:hypothetical protein
VSWRFATTNQEGETVKHLIKSLALAAAAAVAIPAWAADAASAPKARTAQQNKMTACNKQASGKTGDERKAFMKQCLSAKAGGPSGQQEKMKKCNADAAGKTGDERKKFMASCLSAKG